jgi:hypothetical protein
LKTFRAQPPRQRGPLLRFIFNIENADFFHN